MLLKVAPMLACTAFLLAGCASRPVQQVEAAGPRNVIFFLGDGMGFNTMTAARIYAVGEEGDLTMDTLPEAAFIKTYSNDGQVTDSAASMGAYMTGVKMNNEVISMSADTRAIDPGQDAAGNMQANLCGTQNGRAATTLLELAKQKRRATGIVTTTRVTHATPASSYAHVCHRDLDNDIAAMMVPGGAGYNPALQDGIDVVLGGGSANFLPTAAGGKRVDGRNLIGEMQSRGYRYAANAGEFRAIDAVRTSRLLGLFAPNHMSYDLQRDPAREPSLAEMTVKAMDMLSKNSQGYFLMVEGGRIDHALHATTARKALQDVWAFDQAIKTAIDKARQTDPDLKHTLIVVTADHDHSIILNGYARRTGKTTAAEPGVLGLVKRYGRFESRTDPYARDRDGAPYTVIGFGEAGVMADDYHQEAVIKSAPGDGTHGGTDVFLGAIGRGAERFRGTLDNTAVFGLIRAAVGL